MAYIFGLIARLLHCAQAKPVDHIFRGRAEGSGNDFLQGILGGLAVLDYSGRQVFHGCRLERGKKRGQPCFFRRRMHPVKKGNFRC